MQHVNTRHTLVLLTLLGDFSRVDFRNAVRCLTVWAAVREGDEDFICDAFLVARNIFWRSHWTLFAAHGCRRKAVEGVQKDSNGAHRVVSASSTQTAGPECGGVRRCSCTVPHKRLAQPEYIQKATSRKVQRTYNLNSACR